MFLDVFFYHRTRTQGQPGTGSRRESVRRRRDQLKTQLKRISLILTCTREAAGTKLDVGKGEPSRVKATTAAAATAPDTAFFGVMADRRLNGREAPTIPVVVPIVLHFVRLFAVRSAEQIKQARYDA